MSTEKRLKNEIVNLRLYPEDADFIDRISSKYGIKKVELIEALLYDFREVPSDEQQVIIAKYLTRNFPKPKK